LVEYGIISTPESKTISGGEPHFLDVGQSATICVAHYFRTSKAGSRALMEIKANSFQQD